MTETITLKDGTIITGFKNDFITNGLRTNQNYYELGMLNFIRDNIERGVMVDVGANIGNHTIFLAKYCATNVIAFEPYPATIDLLEQNVVENGLDNVEAYCLALSNDQNFVKMKSIEGNAGMNKIDTFGTITVGTVLFDDYTTVKEPITLIKIDCEGYEEKALLGMIETIKKHKPALFIECQTEIELSTISNILLPLGYSNKMRFNATPTYYFDVR
jgi:FkbM family methyltransferase